MSFTTSRADLNGSGDLLDRSRSDEDSWRDAPAFGNRADPDPSFCSLAVFMPVLHSKSGVCRSAL